MSKNNKTISTTGPDLSRFFFSIEEAVSLVSTAIEKSETLRGKVLSLPMKGVEMSRVLNIWADVFQVNWIAGIPRQGDRDLEFLISDSEFSSTKILTEGASKYFVLDLKSSGIETELKASYSSRSAPQLTDNEIRTLITNRTYV
jgi:FlaA1/EpsC-like NDP-sugar epimerase